MYRHLIWNLHQKRHDSQVKFQAKNWAYALLTQTSCLQDSMPALIQASRSQACLKSLSWAKGMKPAFTPTHPGWGKKSILHNKSYNYGGLTDKWDLMESPKESKDVNCNTKEIKSYKIKC